jgi:hypothetical protein
MSAWQAQRVVVAASSGSSRRDVAQHDVCLDSYESGERGCQALAGRGGHGVRKWFQDL